MTLLDDFKRFVADAEAGTQFKTWAHDNPGDLSRWQTFRDAIVAGQRPAVPTMATPHGRELIDAGAQYLDATALAPTPPPGSAWPTSPWPAGSFWNPTSPLSADVAVDPNSAAFIARLLATVTTPKIVTASWNVPVVTVTAKDPGYTVQIVANHHGPTDINRLGPVPIPHGTQPSLPTFSDGGDAHLCLIDYERGFEWDLWQARYDAASDTWTCTTGCAIEISKGQINAQPGIAGGDTGALPLSGGLFTPEEIKAAHIPHPMVFSPNKIAGTNGKPFRWPAEASWGDYDGTDALCAGMRLQLDPSLDVSSLPIPMVERIIARCFQEQGVIVRDQTGGTDGDFYGENLTNRPGAPSWASVGISGNQRFTAAFPWSRMRVLAPTAH